MGNCSSGTCWTTSHRIKHSVLLKDEEGDSKTLDSATAPHHISEDPARTRKSVCITAKLVDSPIESVGSVSESSIEKSRREKKWPCDVAESTSINPHTKNYKKLSETPRPFFHKSILSSPTTNCATSRRVGWTESAAQRPFKTPPPGTPSTCPLFLKDKQSNFSYWGDMYDGTPLLNERDSVQFPSVISFEFSEQLTSRDIHSRQSSVELKNITLLPGHVLGMLLAKKGYQFQMLNLSWSIEEVVDLFLAKECGVRLPLSFSRNEMNPPGIMASDRMQMTIAENLGSQFDVKIQGLIFATGPVNSKLCYKMSVCERREIEKLFSIFGGDTLLKG